MTSKKKKKLQFMFACLEKAVLRELENVADGRNSDKEMKEISKYLLFRVSSNGKELDKYYRSLKWRY